MNIGAVSFHYLIGAATRWVPGGLAVLLFSSQLVKGDGIQPCYFGASPGSLAEAKERLAAGDPDIAKAFKNLLADAQAALKERPPAVTEKTKVPPSGDKHDYMSLAPYFWPNPRTEDGLPYVRHDGRINPQSRDEHIDDSPRGKRLSETIEALALAYYFTTNEIYAAQAAKFARTWFLDPATHMNPNLKFAQAVLGKNDGRGTGILEGRQIAIAADSIGLLAGSKSWTAADQKELDAWLSTYLNWLLNSQAGQDEHAAQNNHGTWFDVQTARLALCLGRMETARRVIEEAKQRRIAVQIEPNGRQPLELTRTKSFSYSCFNLEALGELAGLGQYVGVDLWHYKTSDGRCIQSALGFLLPYVGTSAKPWPYEQIKTKDNLSELMPILRQAALAYRMPEYESIVENNSTEGNRRFQLLFVK